MPVRRLVSLGLVFLAAAPWSVALGVLGLWLLLFPPETGLLARRWVAAGVGCAALAAGHLVFLMCVCDRVFPRADRRLTVPAEGLLGVLFLVGLAGACGGMVWQEGSA